VSKRHREQPRKCFVVISWEGCHFPDFCQAPHVLVDCETHGFLARCHGEDTARQVIMPGHLADPTWPVPVEPLTEACLERIVASKTRKDQLFVPDTYKG
jgi:hypothetical protein